MNYETSQDAVTGQETDYQLSSSQLNLTSPFSALASCVRKMVRERKFKIDVNSINQYQAAHWSMTLCLDWRHVYRLTFWCFMTSTCKSHSRKVLSQQATANSQQLHHCATLQGQGEEEK